MSLGCTVVYMWQCIMDCIELKFNDVISLYKKNDSEKRRLVSLYILYFHYLFKPVDKLN